MREGNDSRQIRQVENMSQLERYFEEIGVQKNILRRFSVGLATSKPRING